MKKFFFLVVLLAITEMALAQKQTVSATTDRQAILIGEQFHLKLNLEIRKGQQPTFFITDTLPHFEILNRSKIDTVPSEHGFILSQTLLLTSWDSGHWQIPSFGSGKIKTAPIGVDVGYTPLAPGQSYHDIKDILSVKPPPQSNWYWYLAGLALLLVLAMLFFPREKPKEKKEEKFVEEKDAYNRALQRIEKLKQERQLPVKDYYTVLVDIFREYLEKRKNISSFSKTTDDLAVRMRELALTPDQYGQLVNTLSLSDMVKFARYEATPDECQASAEIIKQSIVSIEHLK